jgi:hypothetical protein
VTESSGAGVLLSPPLLLASRLLCGGDYKAKNGFKRKL